MNYRKRVVSLYLGTRECGTFILDALMHEMKVTMKDNDKYQIKIKWLHKSGLFRYGDPSMSSMNAWITQR